MRQIFDPQAWKVLHDLSGGFEDNRSRWNLQPLLIVGLTMALDSAPTAGERFESARELDGALRPKQRRCGTTLAGFLSALAQLHLAVLGGVRELIQKAHLKAGTDPARIGRWQVYALDGTKQNLPRTDANEKEFGVATREPALPQSLTVAAIALGQRILWDWACGGAHASERELARTVILRLPDGALCVVDAGFVGYEWVQSVLASGRHLLMRVGANVRLWTQEIGNAAEHGGEVWLWPDNRRKEAPLPLRLIKIVTWTKKKLKRKKRGAGAGRRLFKKVETVLWLLTDVLDETQLTKKEAKEIYERRWGGSEVGFRDWKDTLDAATLSSRTPEQAKRERELSLCAAMLLQALAARARKGRRKPFRVVSVATAARIWRRAVRTICQGKSTRWFGKEMSEAVVDDYVRKGPKVKRRWPKRKDHNMVGKPKFRKLTKAVKALGLKRLEEKCA